MRTTSKILSAVLTALSVSLLACSVPAAPLAYVSNEGSASVSVIGTATDKVVSTLKIAEKPRVFTMPFEGPQTWREERERR